MMKATKYLAYDGVESEFEPFDTIEEARDWIKEMATDGNGSTAFEICDSKIYELRETFSFEVTDRKEDYMYESEDDAPEGEEDQAWPWPNEYDIVGEIKITPFKNQDNESNYKI